MSIFVVIAIVVVGLIAVFFVFRDRLFGANVPAELQPVFQNYQACIEQATRNAIDIAGSQGGRIDTGVYVPGSDYVPFSSHLGFSGLSIPYWYYLSGNNLVKENVPTRSSIEKDMGTFIAASLDQCDFSPFYAQGMYLTIGKPSVSVSVQDTRVHVAVTSRLSASRGELAATKSDYSADVNSKFGTFYKIAQTIYTKERNEAFLENYTVDALRSYAPVDGVATQCSPVIWKSQDVVNDLRTAIAANLAHVTFGKPASGKEAYFAVNVPSSADVRALYAPTWPSKIEITPATQELMMAEPIGDQEGLGALGFCYVPYHFVYDLSFPVLFQIYDGSQIFQFPVSVIVDNNFPRNASLSDLAIEPQADVCSFKQGNADISVYDEALDPVNATIQYQCFDSVCDLGQTSHGTLSTSVPICSNGYLLVSAEGFAEKRQLFSSNIETSADVILEREHDVAVQLKVDGRTVSGTTAVIHFIGESTRSAVLPDEAHVALKEGSYNVSVYVYGNSSITIPASNKRQCQDVREGGIFGFLGKTREQCFDITLPETRIDHALTAGGQSETYILESDLEKGTMVIDVRSLPRPSSLEQLQYNYEIFPTYDSEVSFT